MTASSPTSVGADRSVRRESSSESQYLGALPSRRSTQQPLPQKKALNVSITILSMTGLLVKESAKKNKKKLFNRSGGQKDNEDVLSELSMSYADHAQQQPACTTIVTSFQRTEKQKKIMTHIPSLPLSLPKNSNNNSSTTFNQDIHWPTQDSDSHSKLSSFTFTRYFKREDDETFAAGSKDLAEDTQSGNSTRYAPQLCPIQISISRNGKMFKLGSAHVFISGNEGGLESETGVDGLIKNVPVVNFESAFQAATTTRGLLMSSSSKVNMMRLKGDTLKCGLSDRASVRLLIRVTDPEPLPLTERIQVNYTMAKQTSKDPPAQKKIEQEDSYEYDPSQSAVVLKKKKTLDGFIEKKNMKFEIEQEKNVFRDTQSFGVHSSSSRHGDSVAADNTASDSLSGGSSMVGDDNYSAYSKSSTGLLKMIDDISKHRSRSYGTVTSSFGTVSTSSTMSSSDSYTRRHQEPSSFWVKPIAACKPQWSKHDHWTKRFICCASGSTSGFGEAKDDMVSIHEESRYSLNERNISLQHTVDTDVHGAL